MIERKSITTTLEPPITQICSECGDKVSEEKYTLYQCRKCKSTKLNRPKTLPHNRVFTVKGHYNWVAPDEEQMQYVFNFMGRKAAGFTVDMDMYETEMVPGTPLEIAESIKVIYGNRYSSKDKRLDEVIKYLEETEEESEKNVKINRIQKLKDELYWLLK